MSIVVNTNVNSMMVRQNLSNAASGVSQSLQRLSSGSRINSAADDAAGLTISTSLTAQTNGAATATTNTQSGVNLLQTADGALSVIQTNLQRIRDLSVQAANGTYGTAERAAIQSEVEQRVNEISRIANSSTFNTIHLLNGSNTTLTLQIGANHIAGNASLNTLTIGAPLTSATATALGLRTAGDVGKLSTYFASTGAAASYISKVDNAISTVSSRRTTIGALQNRLTSNVQNLQVTQENLAASNSSISDTDIATEASNLTKNQILQQASVSLLAQANQQPSVALSLI